MKKNLFIALLVSLLLPVPYVMAKGPTALFKPSIIRVQNSAFLQEVGLLKSPEWSLSNENIQKKLQEAQVLLKDVKVRVGNEKIPYTERRVLSDGGKTSVSQQNFKDYEREIALVLLHEKTGKLDVVKVVKRGAELISPKGYKIEVVERMNGIRWNHWATQYKVTTPSDTVVLLNKYPLEKGSGPDHFVYSPYGDELSNPELIKEGAEYLDAIVEQARSELRAAGVKSQAVSGKLVTDLLPADYYKHLPFLEQSDLLEALVDNEWTTNRVLGTLGYNKERAWSMTGNYAGAFGWVQFTDNGTKGRLGTYSTIVKMYPAAKLDPNFKTGAASHVNSMKAAILLHDTNLNYLINKFGADILKNPLLEEYLAASYNGPPSKVAKALTAAGVTGATSKSTWHYGLFEETQGYIAKLRLLNENKIPGKFLN